MGGRREVSVISHRPVTSSEFKQERPFFLGCLNIFATGCLSSSYLRSRGSRLLNRVKHGTLLAPKEVVIKTVFHFPKLACLIIARQKRQLLALLFMW